MSIHTLYLVSDLEDSDNSDPLGYLLTNQKRDLIKVVQTTLRWPLLNQLQTLLLANNILNPRFKSVLIFSQFKSVLILIQSIQIRTN
jgi:hypothetical protein